MKENNREMECIIVDDDQLSRQILEKNCEDTDSLKCVGIFDNAIDAIKFLNKNNVDLMYLDLQMPSFNGFELIETLNYSPMVVIVTSHKEKAIDAFQYDCIIDYMLKPIRHERFLKSVEKAERQRKISQKNTAKSYLNGDFKDHMYVNIDRRLIKIPFEKIDFVEAQGDYIKLVLEDGEHKVHSTLKKTFEKLPKDQFIKVHRSFIVNFNKIIDIEDNSVLIKRNVIPVSRSFRSDLISRLNLL